LFKHDHTYYNSIFTVLRLDAQPFNYYDLKAFGSSGWYEPIRHAETDVANAIKVNKAAPTVTM